MPIFESDEEEYFKKKNQAALERLALRRKKTEEVVVRKSPITGEPMVQEVMGAVVVDRCPTSGGIWLDAGELEELINAALESREHGSALSALLSSLKRK